MQTNDDGNRKRLFQMVIAAPFAVILCLIIVIAAISIVSYLPRTNSPSSPVTDTVPTAEPDESVLKALLVLDGATNLSRHPGTYGSYHVAYSITETYPAWNAIQHISSHLDTLGWKPLKDDWLNPGLPSSHVRGWTDFRDSTTTPMQRVHQWDAQWQDNSGNIVDFSFRCSYPDNGQANLPSVWVNGSWYPASCVKIMQADLPVQ